MELVLVDDQSDTDEAARIYGEFVTDESVDLLLGLYASHHPGRGAGCRGGWPTDGRAARLLGGPIAVWRGIEVENPC